MQQEETAPLTNFYVNFTTHEIIATSEVDSSNGQLVLSLRQMTEDSIDRILQGLQLTLFAADRLAKGSVAK